MKRLLTQMQIKSTVAGLFLMFLLVSCGQNSSPEGRMTTKVEDLRKEMLDSMNVHQAALLDTLAKMREELRTIKSGSK